MIQLVYAWGDDPRLDDQLMARTAGRATPRLPKNRRSHWPAPGEWFVGIALLTGLVWVVCDSFGLNVWVSAGISFVVGYTVRVAALYRGWEEPLAKEPTGVYKHSDGRPLLGRKLAGKSERELSDLGLLVRDPPTPSTSPPTEEPDTPTEQ